MNKIKLEILEFSYSEHFKYAKDVALILPLDHPKRVAVENEINVIREKMNALKNTK